MIGTLEDMLRGVRRMIVELHMEVGRESRMRQYLEAGQDRVNERFAARMAAIEARLDSLEP